MERRNFLTAAMGAAAALIGTTALAKAGPPVAVPPGPVSTPIPPGPVPRPTPSHSPGWRRNENNSARNIRRVRRHLENVIDELQHDQNDYNGHRAQAMTFLQQAREQLLEAEQYDTAHPESNPTARPF
jgi:hypothetical protein